MFEFKASIPSAEMLHCTGVALYCSLQDYTVLQGVGIALYCIVQYSVRECTVMFGCVLYGTILYCSGTLVLLWL